MVHAGLQAGSTGVELVLRARCRERRCPGAEPQDVRIDDEEWHARARERGADAVQQVELEPLQRAAGVVEHSGGYVRVSLATELMRPLEVKAARALALARALSTAANLFQYRWQVRVAQHRARVTVPAHDQGGRLPADSAQAAELRRSEVDGVRRRRDEHERACRSLFDVPQHRPVELAHATPVGPPARLVGPPLATKLAKLPRGAKERTSRVAKVQERGVKERTITRVRLC